jgi:hypothetical protein
MAALQAMLHRPSLGEADGVLLDVAARSATRAACCMLWVAITMVNSRFNS